MTQDLGSSAVVVVVCDLLKISYFISTSSFFSLRYFLLGPGHAIFVLSIEWKDTDRRKELYIDGTTCPIVLALHGGRGLGVIIWGGCFQTLVDAHSHRQQLAEECRLS